MLCRRKVRQILAVARPSDSTQLAGQSRTASRLGLVQMLLPLHVACLLLGTAKVHIADVTPENLGLGLMCLAGEVASQLGLELKVQVALLTIKLVTMRHPMMMLRAAVLLVLLRGVALMGARLAEEAFELLLTFLLIGFPANASGQTRLLYAMLVRPRQGVKRLAADARPVRREATPTRSVLGEVQGRTEQVLAREAVSAEVTPGAEEAFPVVHDVREEEEPAVNLNASWNPDSGIRVTCVGHDSDVRLRLKPVGVLVGVQRGGVGDVHFLRRKMIYCSFLCLNPSLPPYLWRSPSSPLLCVL